MALAALAACRSSDRVEVTIAVASSLRGVVPKIIEAFSAEHAKIVVRAAYGSSGDMRRLVVDGAPIDGVLLANAKPVDDLIASGHVDAASRAVVATNDLVLIAPASSNTDRGLTFATLDALPAGEKLAIGEPGAVPAGQYARDALMKLRKWEALDGRMVFGGNVAEVLAYARRGEVAAAIVYATEMRGIDDVVLLDKAEGDWAPTPQVVVGVVKGGKHAKQATRLFEFVASAAGRKILADHGFGPA